MQRKRVVLCDYNHSCVPQSDIFNAAITQTGIAFSFSFILVPGNGPVLLEMLDCKTLQLLIIICNTIVVKSEQVTSIKTR